MLELLYVLATIYTIVVIVGTIVLLLSPYIMFSDRADFESDGGWRFIWQRLVWLWFWPIGLVILLVIRIVKFHTN